MVFGNNLEISLGYFMKKNLFRILLLFMAIFSIFSCSKKNSSSTTTVKSTSSTAKSYKIAFVIESTKDDKGWCQAMYDGLVAAEKTLGSNKISFRTYEKILAVDSGSIFRQAASEGYNLILAHGAQYKNQIIEVAEEFPDVSFAYGTSDIIAGDNIFTYMPESEETGYLSGLIAGLLTRSNIVGLVGPVDGGDAARYNRGYVLGVKEANPNAKILVAHTGSFSDNAKASEMATSQIKNGADVLTGSSQQAVGALVATESYSDVLWLGQDIAQLEMAAGQKKCVAASSYNYESVIIGLVDDLDKGIKGGKCIPLNFSNGGFIFRYNTALENYLTADMKAKVDGALNKFKAQSGTLSNWKDVDYSKL